MIVATHECMFCWFQLALATIFLCPSMTMSPSIASSGGGGGGRKRRKEGELHYLAELSSPRNPPNAHRLCSPEIYTLDAADAALAENLWDLVRQTPPEILNWEIIYVHRPERPLHSFTITSNWVHCSCRNVLESKLKGKIPAEGIVQHPFDRLLPFMVGHHSP